MWAVPWKLTSVQESNDKGSWFNYSVSQVEMSDVPQAAIVEARDLYNSFRAGDIKTGTGEDKRSEPEGADVPF
jgi:hypothetical protein